LRADPRPAIVTQRENLPDLELRYRRFRAMRIHMSGPVSEMQIIQICTLAITVTIELEVPLSAALQPLQG
jgi:hypothetical protein